MAETQTFFKIKDLTGEGKKSELNGHPFAEGHFEGHPPAIRIRKDVKIFPNSSTEGSGTPYIDSPLMFTLSSRNESSNPVYTEIFDIIKNGTPIEIEWQTAITATGGDLTVTSEVKLEGAIIVDFELSHDITKAALSVVFQKITMKNHGIEDGNQKGEYVFTYTN